MKTDETLLNIIPAPVGLFAVYREGEDETFDPIVAFGQIGCSAGNYTVSMVVDSQTGELSPVENDQAFDRLEWSQNIKVCKCSKPCTTP